MNDSGPNVVVVSAPSGVGKSTILARVLREMEGIRFSVSHTTREPRLGETDGVQYHFVSEDAFDRLLKGGKLLEWAVVHGRRYGTSHAEYERATRERVDLLLDLDVQGAAQVRLKLPEALTLFILPPSYDELERRLRGRGQDDEAAIKRRLATAQEEIGLYSEYDYTLVNDDLERCVADLKAVIRAARWRTCRREAAAARILKTFPKPNEE